MLNSGKKIALCATKKINILTLVLLLLYTALRRKSKDWFAWYQDNVSEWGDMSIHVCCFSEPALYKIQLSMLV
jgi:predicted LPLAT superfamily acyltransferase